MDSATLRYYSQNAHAVAQRYEDVQSPLASHFTRIFPPGGRILDIGEDVIVVNLEDYH